MFSAWMRIFHQGCEAAFGETTRRSSIHARVILVTSQVNECPVHGPVQPPHRLRFSFPFNCVSDRRLPPAMPVPVFDLTP
jgi:hypothetical protein